jgi:hypothetical protein
MVDLVKFLKEAAKSHPALYRIVFLVFSPVFIYPGRDMFSLLKKRGCGPVLTMWSLTLDQARRISG